MGQIEYRYISHFHSPCYSCCFIHLLHRRDLRLLFPSSPHSSRFSPFPRRYSSLHSPSIDLCECMREGGATWKNFPFSLFPPPNFLFPPCFLLPPPFLHPPTVRLRLSLSLPHLFRKPLRAHIERLPVAGLFLLLFQEWSIEWSAYIHCKK